jgi:hypothetical protein
MAVSRSPATLFYREQGDSSQNVHIMFIIDHLIFNVYGPVHHKNILIYVQKDAMLHSLFYLETVSGSTTSHHQERK